MAAVLITTGLLVGGAAIAVGLYCLPLWCLREHRRERAGKEAAVLTAPRLLTSSSV